MGKRGKALKRKRAGLEAPPRPPPEERGSDSDAADPLGGIPAADVAATIRTLEALGRDATLFRSRPFKRLRGALAPCAAELLGSDDGGRRRKGREVTDEERRRVMDRDALNQRALRRERLERLEALTAPDGPALIADGPALGLLEAPPGAAPARLHRARPCYTCKAPFQELHHFYHALCPACAALNWEKRSQRADLRGRGALVTGARVKIGFRVALTLLRCGARVVATTRFPADAAQRYAREEDAGEWRDRLTVVGCDFRDLGGVEALCAAVPGLLSDTGLDVLVNNACQTVRRPPQYYAPTVRRERGLRALVGGG
eukprot:CAMPEP_0119270778 /NCGR_PEP_ID=MMETSP1329-20130426/7645_1 /TAXON_ID=114041 /ORGANISM="Genus nov. species nov., Strain RCC1024" /LENGTH=315 /DNA_ID=CAMNT_0007270809 /DNA_START=85 /DNA_END=1028 /DNA_ORIENTATION=-